MAQSWPVSAEFAPSRTRPKFGRARKLGRHRLNTVQLWAKFAEFGLDSAKSWSDSGPWAEFDPTCPQSRQIRHESDHVRELARFGPDSSCIPRAHRNAEACVDRHSTLWSLPAQIRRRTWRRCLSERAPFPSAFGVDTGVRRTPSKSKRAPSTADPRTRPKSRVAQRAEELVAARFASRARCAPCGFSGRLCGRRDEAFGDPREVSFVFSLGGAVGERPKSGRRVGRERPLSLSPKSGCPGLEYLHFGAARMF